MSMQHIEDEGITVVETPAVQDDAAAVAVLARSEITSQLDAAHRYPRKTHNFLAEARGLATLTRDVAESCIYALPRGGKTISGPSVRLAEICASAYGNLHVAARVVDVTDKEVVAQGVAWDLEKNLRVTVEARRRITYKNGKRYDDDMITVTGAAAGSIALRNAIFRVIPRAYVDALYQSIREVAVGNAKTLSSRREEVVARLQKIGVPIERIFARVGKASIEDIGLDELEILIGLGTSVKNGTQALDEAFPAVDHTADKSRDLEAKLGVAPRAPKSAPKAAPVVLEMPKVEVDPVTGEVVPPDVGVT
jgi:hypothetical protein